MKLLVLTQKVDKNDDLLGFIHTWLIKFSEKFESIVVICLYEGEHSLPQNVEVLSLGKEKGASKFGYIKSFYRHISNKRKEYDTVFVHMNPEYIVLGGLFWKLMRKKIYVWFNHPKGSLSIRVAKHFVQNIFCTSNHAFATRYKKTILMPAGIDTSIFRNLNLERADDGVLVLGRISPVKNLHKLDPALRLLDTALFNYQAHVYGDAPPQDVKYKDKWVEGVSDLLEQNKIILEGSISNAKTPNIYNKYKVYVNLTPSGSFDKTILEAMSCGVLPVVSNESFRGVLPDEYIFEVNDSAALASAIKKILNTPEHELERERRKLESYVRDNQSLDALIVKITDIICAR